MMRKNPQYLNRAVNSYENKSYERALELAELAIKENKKDARPWVVKAGALFYLKRYKEVIKAAERAIKLDKKLAYAWAWKAAALEVQGETEKAHKVAAYSWKLDPHERTNPVAKAVLARTSPKRLEQPTGTPPKSEPSGMDSESLRTLHERARKIRESVPLSERMPPFLQPSSSETTSEKPKDKKKTQ
jgi:tetratricopeptide (TPR) repeat protein